MRKEPEYSQLKSLIPELKYKSLTYDMAIGEDPPKEGEYMVSIGRKTKKVGTIYQIAAVRLITPKRPRHFNRWHLTTIVTNDMRDKVVITNPLFGPKAVYVGGRLSWAIEWYPRSKKKR